jgi:hypothetical protein
MAGFDLQSYLARTRQLESGGRDNAVSSTGAAGPYQFTLGTAKRYGLSPQDRFSYEKSHAAALRLAMDNASQLRRVLGRQPTSAEVYLAHQQGAGGASALLRNPQMSAAQALSTIMSPARARQAISVNGGNPDAPASAFAGKWLNKFDGGKSIPMMAAAAPSMQTPTQAPPIEAATSNEQLDLEMPPMPPVDEPDDYAPMMAMGDEGGVSGDMTDLSDVGQMPAGDFEMADASAGISDAIHQKAAMGRQRRSELASPLGQLFTVETIGQAGKRARA